MPHSPCIVHATCIAIFTTHESSDWQDSPQEESAIYETNTVMKNYLIDIKVQLGGTVEDGGAQNAIYVPEQVLVSFPILASVKKRKMVAVRKVAEYLDWGQATRKVVAPRPGEVLLGMSRVACHEHLAVERGWHSAPRHSAPRLVQSTPRYSEREA